MNSMVAGSSMGKFDDTTSVADSAYGTASSGITAATFTGVSQISEVRSIVQGFMGGSLLPPQDSYGSLSRLFCSGL